jgi:hypothetical protein
MTYHPTIHTNIHDVTSIHVHHKGKVWSGDNPPDLTETTDITITMSSGQQVKFTTFHEAGIVPTFSSKAEEEAAKADPIPTTEEVTTS